MTTAGKRMNSAGYEYDVEISLQAVPENVAVVRHALGGLADLFMIPDPVLADIKLAVSEACANVVVHAYDGEPGPLEVLAGGTGEGELTVVVRDRGSGIAPRTDSPGLGVGLALIATLTDLLELTTTEDGATEVRMCFRYGDGARDDANAAARESLGG